MKSIKTKILFVVIAGLLVTTAVVSAISVNMMLEVMYRDADRILSSATRMEAAKINDELGDVMKSCRIMENYITTELEDAVQLKDESFRSNYLEKVEFMFTEVAVNTNGIEGFYLRINPEISNGTSGFYNMVKEDGSLRKMPLTDITKYDKDDSKNVGWYYSAVNAGTGVWLDPYFFPGNGNELISYTSPLYVNEELIGVVGFDMNFSYLIKRIEEISVYENGRAVLIDDDGKTVYSEASEKRSGNDEAESKEELKNGMYLKMSADYKDIQRDILPMITRIVVAFLIVFVCAIVYTVLLTQRIVGPLKKLTKEAKELSIGIDDAGFDDVNVKSEDEIGTLSRVLTATYSKVQEYTSYINTLAYRDSLTGIKNSTAYAEATEILGKEMRSSTPQFGVLVADINNLKQTNDRFGHDIGNELIVHTARLLTDVFKTSAVFRIGGDEFVVILRGSDYTNYREMIDKFDDACSNDVVIMYDNWVQVSVARGVAMFDPEADHVYEDVFAKADQAMYVNKEQIKSALDS